MEKNKELIEFKKRIRVLVANYVASEGCSCCRGESHKLDGEKLAKALKVKKYPDGSGYDFYYYKSNTS